jgi:hypothetical protein
MDIKTVNKNADSPEMLREIGKAMLAENNPDNRREAFGYLLRAKAMGDPEAGYIIGELVLQRQLVPTTGDAEEHALEILAEAAYRGSIQARSRLNEYCRERYEKTVDIREPGKSGPLTGFDGKKIKINRTGILTPIDAVLEYKDGKNILTLSANIMVLGNYDFDTSVLKKAVIDGIREWEGDYLVFGNQKLQVRMDLTDRERLFDSIIVLPVFKDLESSLRKTAKKLPSDKSSERITSMLNSKRSYATLGIKKWSATSRKIIVLQSEDGEFNDYGEIFHVAKHEFGHALGLGDLYESREDLLGGVKKGSFSELDGYYIKDNMYNLVMCDHHGPISNNDIEMVVLAFSENKFQQYQPFNKNKKISKALGRGN